MVTYTEYRILPFLRAFAFINVTLFYISFHPMAFAAPERAQITTNILYPNAGIKLWKDDQGDERITILFETTHAYDLSIITPDGKDYVVYDDFSKINPNRFRHFRNSVKITTEISEFFGTGYKNGRPYVEKIFQEKGLYCFHFSSNLEAHLGDTYFNLIAVQWPIQSAQTFRSDEGKCMEHFPLTP